MREPNTSGPTITEDEINSFIQHRVNRDEYTVSIEVSRQGGKSTWLKEQCLHDMVPHLLSKYWKNHGSRDSATGLKKYVVHRILGHRVQEVLGRRVTRRTTRRRRKQIEYEVEWVGYPVTKKDKTNVTWEDAYKIENIASDALEKYWSSLD
jgi:hypothetical protein